MNEIPISFRPDLQDEFSRLNLCGSCNKFIQVLELIKQISKHQATVLIQGETGTGKENAARAIHYLGARSTCPFVPINCATIADDLLESELFGHEKGAFTDARQTKEGLVAVANGGSLFLDEVDSLSPKAQAALLRFLQTQEYRPVGAKKLLRANVRIIAATNADLKQLVEHKKFREDLFFRLNVLHLVMPPLRERKADMGIIAESLLQRFAREYELPLKWLSPSSLQYLQQQSWPGNVREFENTLLRAYLLSSGNYIAIDGDSGCATFTDEKQTARSQLGAEQFAVDTDTADYIEIERSDIGGAGSPDIDYLDPAPSMLASFQDAKARAIIDFEKKYLSQIMQITHGNVTLAAKISGKERRALGKLLQKYHIDKSLYR
jgi:DNA-binding NtrC family response regulator